MSQLAPEAHDFLILYLFQGQIHVVDFLNFRPNPPPGRLTHLDYCARDGVAHQSVRQAMNY